MHIMSSGAGVGRDQHGEVRLSPRHLAWVLLGLVGEVVKAGADEVLLLEIRVHI